MANKKRALITANNVARAFPHCTDEWKGAVARGAYENLGITMAELMLIPSISKQEMLAKVRISGLDTVRSQLDNGQGIVLVSGHMGNWEWMAIAAGLLLQSPLTIVTHPQRNAKLDAVLNTYRTRFGNVLTPMHQAAKTLVRTVKQGGVVAFLADQHANPEKDPWIEFFGTPTPTYAAPAALALRMQVPLHFGVSIRQEDSTYNVCVSQVHTADLDDSPASIVELTRRHVQMLEQEIRKHPQLWSWQHRRWRDNQITTLNAHDGNRYAKQTAQ